MVQVNSITLFSMEQLIGYAGRFASALKASGMDVGTFASTVGLSYQAVKKLEAGSTKMLTACNNARAAAILGVSSDWLATGEGQRQRFAQQFSDAALRVAAIYDQVSAKDRRYIDAAVDAAASPDDPPEPVTTARV